MQNKTKRKILQSAFALFLLILLAPTILILVVLLPIRLTVSLIAKIFRSDLSGLVYGGSAATTGYTSANLVFFMFIDGKISTNRGRSLFKENVLTEREPNGDYKYKRLKQTWTTFCGFKFWQKDTNFKLTNHVREYDYGGDMQLSSGSTEEDVQGVVSGLLGASWEKGLSPWEAFFVPMSEDGDSPRTLFIFRIHHALADGYSCVGLFRALAQTEFPLPSPKKSYQKQVSVRDILRIPYDLAGILLDSWDFQESWHFPVERNPRDFHTSPFKSFKVGLIKQAAAKTGVSYAAALYAVVGGGIQRIFEEAGLPAPEYLTTLAPFPRPDHPGGLENHLNMGVFYWPIKSKSTAQRAIEIHEKFTQLTQSITTGLTFILPDVIGLMPAVILDFLANAIVSGGSVLTTNFPVTAQEIYLDKKPVKNLYAAFGPPGNSIGTSVLMCGVNGDQVVVLNMDKRIFPSERIFRRFAVHIQEELQNLLLQ